MAKDYSPDLCWITSICDHPQPASLTVLRYFPHSQHRPLLIHIGLQLLIIHGSSKKRWNLRKADWDLYSSKLERSNHPFSLYPNRGGVPTHQRNNFQCCYYSHPSSQAHLEEYEGSGNPDIADHLI